MVADGIFRYLLGGSESSDRMNVADQFRMKFGGRRLLGERYGLSNKAVHSLELAS